MIRDRNDVDAVRRALSDPGYVVDALGLTSRAKRQSNGGFLICCPAHADSTASLSVRVGADQTIQVRCFGCDLSGDALTLIAAVEGLDLDRDFAKVLQRGGELAGMSPGRTDRPARPAHSRPATPPPKPAPERLDVETFDAMVRPLATLGRLDGRGISEAPSAYLARRGLLDEARGDGWFALGPYCGNLLTDIFGAEFVAKTGLFDRGRLGWATHSLAIPWRDFEGRIDTVQRRRIDDAGDKKYIFPTARGALQPYGIDRLGVASSTAEIVIVEGAIDVLARRRVESEGRVILGAAGVSWALSFDWSSIVSGRVVRVAFDADAAGDDAAEKLAARLFDAGATRVQRERVRRGKDWGDVALSREATS